MRSSNMSGLRWYIVIVVTLLVVLVACGPKAAPVPPLATPVPQAASTAPAPATPALSPEEADWQKVVEAAKKEGKLIVYSGALVGDSTRAASEAFRSRYGITLEVVGGVGAVLAERIKTENAARKYVADVADVGVPVTLPIKGLGLLANLSGLPVLSEKDVWYQNPIVDPDGVTMLHYRVALQAPVVNTKLVRPDQEPKSFFDFLDAKWRGKKLVAGQPRISWPLVQLHVMLPDLIDEKFLRALGKQDLLIVANIREEAAVLARGEVSAVVSTTLALLDSLIKEGAPLKPLVMREGTIVASGAVTVLKNAPHPNAARLFVNWWLSREGQAVINKVAGVPSVRNDVPDFSYEPTRLKPIKLLPLDEAAFKTVAKYVSEERVDKFLGVETK